LRWQWLFDPIDTIQTKCTVAGDDPDLFIVINYYSKTNLVGPDLLPEFPLILNLGSLTREILCSNWSDKKFWFNNF
jgi:hypothetical protein